MYVKYLSKSIRVDWAVFFFFKQKTAYEMRISDWSSDVCSSDLQDLVVAAADLARELHAGDVRKGSGEPYFEGHLAPVAAIVAADGGTAEQVAAAYLHDAAEDHGGPAQLDVLRARCGDGVADTIGRAHVRNHVTNEHRVWPL